MNNLEPFEEHLAGQFQQVPVPNRDEGWIEMRKLLDRELPEGATAWSGNRKWWWMGITVAIIITGLWLREELRKKDIAEAQRVAAFNNKSSAQQQVSPNEINKESKNSATSRNDDSNSTRTPDDKKINDGGKKKIEDRSNSPEYDDHLISSNRYSNDRNENKTVGSNSHLKVNKGNASVAKLNAAGTSAHSNSYSTEASNKPHTRNSKTREEELIQNNSNYTDNNFEKGYQLQFPIEPATSTLSENSIVTSEMFFTDPAKQLSTVPPSQPIKAEPGKTDKVFAKRMRKSSVEADDRKMSARNMRGDMREKDQDLTFAAGVALPQSFAIASQQSPSYGVNASSSRVSDYLPVPFFQYHMNSKLFMQTELQFQSPQYTDRLLVSQDQQQIAQTTTLEKNVFIEKLYYFHIPFDVYFSPARNFYIGSGIQFSSLLSGVATYETNRYNGSTLENTSSKVEGFKDDSIASKLSSSEWRYQFDANYYFKRFTFGARYNQAFSQFVNLQPSPTLPFTQARNQSFFIYLRYNIWEERKKGSFYSE